MFSSGRQRPMALLQMVNDGVITDGTPEIFHPIIKRLPLLEDSDKFVKSKVGLHFGQST